MSMIKQNQIIITLTLCLLLQGCQLWGNLLQKNTQKSSLSNVQKETSFTREYLSRIDKSLKQSFVSEKNIQFFNAETSYISDVNFRIIDKDLFKTNSVSINEPTKMLLAQLASILNIYKHSKLKIIGYTDNTGSDVYNEKLSKSRAESIASYLIIKGLTPQRIETIGYGEKSPIANNNTAIGRAQNRRIEIQIYADKPIFKDDEMMAQMNYSCDMLFVETTSDNP